MTHFYSLRTTRLWLGAALLCLFATLTQAQTIRYVKPVATGTGDGSSWANAAGNLQRTIDRSAPDDQVWVAAGLYKPNRIPPGLDPTDERNKTFFFSNGVKVFGGFDGTETAADQRDLTGPSSTTLSGDRGGPKVTVVGSATTIGFGDDSYITVTIRGSSKTLLDGLVITGVGTTLFNDGSSDLSPTNTGSQPAIRNCHMICVSYKNYYPQPGILERGGSRNSGATYTNCTISGFPAEGIRYGAVGGSCTPTFINCQIHNNGSGVRVYPAVNSFFGPTLINCSLTNNHLPVIDLTGGVGILELKLVGCLIVDCIQDDYHKSLIDINVYDKSGKVNLSLLNCTIVHNNISKLLTLTNNSSNALKSDPTITIKNCVIAQSEGYDNPYSISVSHCILAKGSPLTGISNIYASPNFEFAEILFNLPTIDNVFRHNYQLSPTSPGVNAGDPNTNPKDLPATDLDGNPRFQGRIDIGAYERDVLPNRAPVALTHPDEAAIMGIPYLSGGQEAFFFDPEDKPMSLTAAGLPGGLSLIQNAAGSYAISGTPTTTGVSSVTLTAKDPAGLSASLTFQLVVDTAPVAFQLTAPTYNCQTGAFTFNSTGGDGSTIEYQASGITGWSSNPNQYVDSPLRTANDVAPFTLMARQKGVVVSYTWNLKTVCGRARVAASEGTDGLSVRVLGNPIAGETAQVEISGVDGQAVTLSLTDAQGKTVSTEQINQATATETRTIRLGQSAGSYLLRATTGTQSWTVRVVKP